MSDGASSSTVLLPAITSYGTASRRTARTRRVCREPWHLCQRNAPVPCRACVTCLQVDTIGHNWTSAEYRRSIGPDLCEKRRDKSRIDSYCFRFYNQRRHSSYLSIDRFRFCGHPGVQTRRGSVEGEMRQKCRLLERA